MAEKVLLPVGKRPKCLRCKRELKPNFKRDRLPLFVPAGETISVRDPFSYGRGMAEYKDHQLTRPLTDAERTAWRKEHPPIFDGTYGRYHDSRFCGLNCGYRYALRVTAGRS